MREIRFVFRWVWGRQVLLLFVAGSLQIPTVAAAGVLYRADLFGHTLYGSQVIGMPDASSGLGETAWPIMSLAVDPNTGTVYASSPGGVSKNTYSGSSVLLNGVTGSLRTDPAGNLYVFAGSRGTFKITPSGILSVVSGVPGQFLAADLSGNFYTANGSAVSKTDPNGHKVPFATLVNSPLDAVFDSQGNLFVHTDSGVERVAPDGTDVLYCSWADAPYPFHYSPVEYYPRWAETGICVDEFDTVYFIYSWFPSGMMQSPVDTYSSDGTWTFNWGGHYPGAIAYSPLDAVPTVLTLGETVPEPASLPVLALGAGVIMLRRRGVV